MKYKTFGKFAFVATHFVFCYVWLTNNFTSGQTVRPSMQPEAYFNGSTYIRLYPFLSLKRPIGLSFRTCSEGLLFYESSSGTYIQLGVAANGITFKAHAKGKVFEELIMGNYSDNRWHNVYFTFVMGNLTISIDGKEQVIANRSYRTELLTMPEFYNEQFVVIIGKQYTGCIIEGPSIVFNETNMLPYGVIFGKCPIDEETCTVRLDNDKDKGFNYCSTEPCMGHGYCKSINGTYNCTCTPRYTGRNCELDMGSPCNRAPPICRNSGRCSEDERGNYNCRCSPTFTGQHCETVIETDPLCSPNPCVNGGSCTGIVETNNVYCACASGFTGQYCEKSINECKMSPCKNRGTCIDTPDNFTCDCDNTGYQGRVCEINVNECVTAKPCLNNGQCFDNPGGYFCACPNGFSGQNCQDKVNECLSQPCLNNGRCDDKSGDYECYCPAGYKGQNCEMPVHETSQCDTCGPLGMCSDDGSSCVCKPEYSGLFPNCKPRTCNGNTCQNGGTCVLYSDSFNCTCPPGYKGSACERSAACLTHACRNGGTCFEDLHSHNCLCPNGFKGLYCDQRVKCVDRPCTHDTECIDFPQGYYCSCEPGWSGLNCDTNVDECLSNPCFNNGTCVDRVPFFVCECLPGFSGERCQFTGDCDCLNGGTCLNTVNGNVCKCTESYAGIKCERSINVCEGKCLNGGVCKVGPNKIDYTCECPSGFQGANCEITYDTYNDLCAKVTCPKHSDCTVAPGTYNYSCECHMGFAGPNCDDIDECAEQSGVCNNGICKNLIGGFQCYCQPGYTGEKCTLDINECLSLPCENNGNCLDEINNYRCVCPPGFTGKTCAVDIDECESNPCQYDSVCDDRINGFICICNPGLTGIFCDTNIDDCLSKPCRNGGSCEDGLNNYTCNCTNTGYTGYDCEENIDDCFSNPCVNGGTCHDRINNYVCQCHNGYTGKNCETDINECLKNPCKHSGTCLERSNQTLYQSPATTVLPNRYKGSFSYNAAEGFDCLCVPGTTGETCETDVNECDSSPCKFGNCIDKLNSYSCQCDDGFEGEVCDVEINECIRYKPCLNGECRDRRANYYCDCKAGFGGKNCSVELTGCKTNPCKSNGTCIPYVVNETDHHYNCTCQNGFFGPTCETLTTMSLSGSSSILVNTTREEGYDIQFRFKTTLGEGLLVVGVGHTFCILELSKGRLNLHSSLLNKWEGVFIGSNLNDSRWQRVFVAINTSHIVLSANDEQTIYPITNTDNNTSVTSFPTTYIGGNPNEAKALTHGKPPLVGCIEDVIINSQWVLPETGSDFMRFQGVKAGCERKPRCSPNPCHSGGHCTDKWVDFSCTCERPYLGHTCQYNFTAATFGYENIKNSLATVTVDKDAKRAVRTIVDISMFIRTRQSRSQIFYLGSAIGSPKDQEETYIAAQLEGGELLVRIQFHGNPEFYTVGSVKLDNGYNHLIEVFRNVTLVQVKINGTEYFRKTISATGTLDAEVLFLGGQPGLRPVRDVTDSLPKPETAAATAPATVTTPLSMINFKGIIQDVQISNGTKIMVVEFFPLKVVDLHIPMPFGIVSFDNNTVFPGVLSDDLCKPNPCHQNASCINTWNDYQCNCNKGFKGKDCKELEFCELYPCPNGSECKNLQDGKECIANATFDGDTKPLLYQFHTTSHDDNGWAFVESLEISYRTKTKGTIFFAVLDTNYLVIYVHYKDVIFHWKMNGINETHTFRKDDFRGQWVTLYFRIKDSAIKGGFKELVNDDTPNFTQNDFDYTTFSQLILNGAIYVGGSDGKSYDHTFLIKNKNAIPDTTIASVISDNNLIPQYDGKVETNELYEITSDDRFKGCLGEIRINELLVPYFPIAELYKEELPSKYFNLMGGAQHSITCQLCFNKDCNRGTCSDPFNSYVCDCPIGFTADDCSVDIDECQENQCQNNAQCIDEIGKYSCNCSLGYGGELCDHDIDECESNPCQNNATCVDLLGRFACNCTEEYVGDQCEYLRLITCSDEPCKEGSMCVNKEDLKTGNNFTCECAEGMTGTVCDVPYCRVAECKNGGICNVDVRPPRCECQPGFEGNLCTIDIDDCASVPCLNRGICQDRVYGYTCYCNATGYTGMNCEMDINECEQPSNPCGQGKCKNTPGAYLCTCDNQKCGYNCNFDDPCLQNPCVNDGVCKSVCVNEPDYNCNCIDAWTGKNCTEYEIASPARADGFNILYIVIPIVVVIVAGLLVAFVILVNIARSKRATRGTYSPSAQEFCNPRVELDHVLKPPPEERLI